MATPSPGDAEFLFGRCPLCGTEVLTYADFESDGTEARRCLACQTTISADLHAATWMELEASGYVVVEARTCGGGCTAEACGRPKL